MWRKGRIRPAAVLLLLLFLEPVAHCGNTARVTQSAPRPSAHRAPSSPPSALPIPARTAEGLAPLASAPAADVPRPHQRSPERIRRIAEERRAKATARLERNYGWPVPPPPPWADEAGPGPVTPPPPPPRAAKGSGVGRRKAANAAKGSGARRAAKGSGARRAGGLGLSAGAGAAY